MIVAEYSWRRSTCLMQPKGGKFGCIDKAGDLVLELSFDWVDSFSEGLAQAEKDGKWGLIDKAGKWVVKPQFEYVSKFSEGLGVLNKDGKWGIIHRSGVGMPGAGGK